MQNTILGLDIDQYSSDSSSEEEEEEGNTLPKSSAVKKRKRETLSEDKIKEIRQYYDQGEKDEAYVQRMTEATYRPVG